MDQHVDDEESLMRRHTTKDSGKHAGGAHGGTDGNFSMWLFVAGIILGILAAGVAAGFIGFVWKDTRDTPESFAAVIKNQEETHEKLDAMMSFLALLEQKVIELQNNTDVVESNLQIVNTSINFIISQLTVPVPPPPPPPPFKRSARGKVDEVYADVLGSSEKTYPSMARIFQFPNVSTIDAGAALSWLMERAVELENYHLSTDAKLDDIQEFLGYINGTIFSKFSAMGADLAAHHENITGQIGTLSSTVSTEHETTRTNLTTQHTAIGNAISAMQTNITSEINSAESALSAEHTAGANAMAYGFGNVTNQLDGIENDMADNMNNLTNQHSAISTAISGVDSDIASVASSLSFANSSITSIGSAVSQLSTDLATTDGKVDGIAIFLEATHTLPSPSPTPSPTP